MIVHVMIKQKFCSDLIEVYRLIIQLPQTYRLGACDEREGTRVKCQLVVSSYQIHPFTDNLTSIIKN